MGHDVLGQDPIEQERVGLRENPPDRGFAGRKEGLLPGRPAATEPLELALGEIPGPAGDRLVGTLSGQDPGQTDQENGQVVVPDPPGFPGIVHRGPQKSEQSVLSVEAERGQGQGRHGASQE